MNDIGANLADLLNKTIGVFIAALVGGFGLMLGLRSAGWKPSLGATVNFFEGRRNEDKSLDDRPQPAEGTRSEEPRHVVQVPSNLDVLMKAIRFDDELLSEHEIKILRQTVRHAIRTELCPRFAHILDSQALRENCTVKVGKCGDCWFKEYSA